VYLLNYKYNKFIKGLIWFIIILFLSCIAEYEDHQALNPHENPKTYFSTMESLIVEVAYEEGARPFDGNLDDGNPLWSITEDNLNAVFRSRLDNIEMNVPLSIEQMESIPHQNQIGFTLDDIRDIANYARKRETTETNAVFFVLFLNGYLKSNGHLQKGVIGINLSGTGIIAMFKPVILAIETEDYFNTVKFIEQYSLIHELGHALGLVNSGVSMVKDHHDYHNGSHCTDDTCVMYWLNEGVGELENFVERVANTGQKTLFGENCLSDSNLFIPVY
jgi:hypothetical protein